MQRFLLALLLGLLVLVGVGDIASAREAVWLPLSCELRNGRLTTTRLAQPKLYTILATRQRQVYNVCAPENPARCRAILVHRFDLSCGADSVPWVEIAAALINEHGGQASTKQGRLHVLRAAPPAPKGEGGCTDKGAERAEASSSYSLDERLPGDPCRQGKDAGWAFPPGYAPLGELGATLVVSVQSADGPPAPARERSAAHDSPPAAPPAAAAEAGAARADAGTAPARKETGPAPASERAAASESGPRAASPAQSPPRGGTEDAAPPSTVRLAAIPAELSDASAWGIVGRRADTAAPALPSREREGRDGEARPGAPASPDGPAAGTEKAAGPADDRGPAAAAQPAAADGAEHADTAEPDAGADADAGPIVRVVSNIRWSSPEAGEMESWLPGIEPAAVVELVAGRVREIRFERSFATMVMALALVSGLLTAVGWYASRQVRPTRAPRIAKSESGFSIAVRPAGALAPADAEMCGELCGTAHSLLRQIGEKMDELQGVAPLRRVLQREMRHLEQFLTAVTAASPAEAEEWRRMRNRLQRIVKELMRLKEIVEGAYRSLSSAGFAKNEPRDRHEAYEVLGVNADVDPRTLKKLVDALRTCWHPDFAKDEQDRVLREERMKRINIAWDIINAKRQEA